MDYGKSGRILRTALTAAAVCFVAPAEAYNTDVHRNLTEEAVARSLLANTAVLQELDLTPATQYVGTDGVTYLLPQLLGFGAQQEDDGEGNPVAIKRFCNHFFDPQFGDFTGRGLDTGGNRGQPSPDWALEDRFEVTTLADAGCLAAPAARSQDFSYRHALAAYYQALTLPTPAARNAQFSLAFQILGQVVHHLQDMAQPQHTRNEAHPKAFYEAYTRRTCCAVSFRARPQLRSFPGENPT